MLVFPLRFLYSDGHRRSDRGDDRRWVALTVLPALLYVLGDRVNGLAPKRLRARPRPRPGPTSGTWYRLAMR